MNLPSRFARVATAAVWVLTTSLSAADTPIWNVDTQHSKIQFATTQQNAEFQGSFARFRAEIRFAPEAPAAGAIKAVVSMDSVNTQNKERDDYLVGSDFFNAALFPEARFESTTITADANGGFKAVAALTIRDITREVVLPFQWQRSADNSVHFTGELTLQRLDFGIGQGIWSDTAWVGADVRVQVSLILTP